VRQTFQRIAGAAVDGLTNADAAGKGGCGVEHSGHHDDGDLADWLGLNVSELDWFADLKGLACKRNQSRLSHYHYRIPAKESGNIRLMEAPKARLKELQQKILREILERIPVHDTRYADDLAFSGDEDFERRAKRFSIHAAAMVMKEGFRINHRKTRVIRRSVRQHLAGLIANQRVNIRRANFDRLKAILTNCVGKGVATQNRDGHKDSGEHLKGRIAFLASVNPVRGQRLRATYEQIRWE